MSAALRKQHHHGSPGFLSGVRNRHIRVLVVAGVFLMFVWIISRNGLSRGRQYRSGFDLANSESPLATADRPSSQYKSGFDVANPDNRPATADQPSSSQYTSGFDVANSEKPPPTADRPSSQPKSGFDLANSDQNPTQTTGRTTSGATDSTTSGATDRTTSGATDRKTSGAAGPPPISTVGNQDLYLAPSIANEIFPHPPGPSPASAPAPAPPPSPPADFPDSVAVIIETDIGKVAVLVPLILHFAAVLGPTYPVVLLTLRSTWIEPPSPGFKRLMQEGRVHIHFLPPRTTFATREAAAIFLTQPWLWEHFESTNRVLLFQAGSVLCANSAARPDDFAQWDFVGAAVAAPHGAGVHGGLSLRNPRAMLDVIRESPVSFADGLREAAAAVARAREAGGEAAARKAARAVPRSAQFEDQWFWSRLQEMNAARKADEQFQLPGWRTTKMFAVETVWSARPLGFHRPFQWLNSIELKRALEWCPELAMVKEEEEASD